MVRCAQHRHEARRLLEKTAQIAALLVERDVGGLDRVRPPEDPGFELHGVAALAAAQTMQFGDVYGVLHDDGQFAVAAAYRRMGGAPEAFFPHAVGSCYGVGNQRQNVDGLFGDDARQRGAQHAAAGRFGIAGKGVEQVATHQAFARAAGDAQIGVVHADDGESWIENDVWIWRGVEQFRRVDAVEY